MSEKQRAVALLVALGQFNYRQIAQQVGIHYNSVTDWLKDERIQALVSEIQQDIQDKMESQALASVQRKNDLLLPKALEQLEKMLHSRSQRKQLHVIKFLLSYGRLPGVTDEPQDDPQEGQPSRIRLSPEAQAWLKAQ